MKPIALLALLLPALAVAGGWERQTYVDDFDGAEIHYIELTSVDGGSTLTFGCERGKQPMWRFRHSRTLYQQISTAGSISLQVPMRFSVDGKAVGGVLVNDWPAGEDLYTAETHAHRAITKALAGERLIIRVRLGTGETADVVFDISGATAAVSSLKGVCRRV